MAKGILGKKLGMTQIQCRRTADSRDRHRSWPVHGSAEEDLEKDSYLAVQLGFGERRKGWSTSQKLDISPRQRLSPRVLREVRFNPDEEFAKLNVGDSVDVSIFHEGETVDVTATSRGKGFQGSIKRHNQGRGRMSHGSKYHRRVGSHGSIAGQGVQGTPDAGPDGRRA